MHAWVLEYCGYEPGFLIGGVPQNFGVSARLGNSVFFVVEADEYDSAFFDKRSKFVHYHPRTLVINNLEFDHADIFADLAAIQRQFNHVIRTVPGEGKVIWPSDVEAVQQVIDMGCWSEQEIYSKATSLASDSAQQGEPSAWQSRTIADDGHEFEVLFKGESQGILNWALIGQHNIENAIMAIAAARHVGVAPSHAIEALAQFSPPKRRLELLATVNGVCVYDDFAHHPTAIATTLQGLRAKVASSDNPNGNIIVVLEPRSNTMKSGVHKDTLANSMALADVGYLYQADNIGWDIHASMANAPIPVTVFNNIEDIISTVATTANQGDTVVIMSNGGFNGIHQKIIKALA
jgi:UDP-N-acetylmuramate: L-alanyl-gamma-D-glutamyl-meso-diaminopimelate ligase